MHVFFLHNKKKTSRTEWQTINLPYQILFDLREQTRTSLVTMHVFFLHNNKKTSRAADRRLIDWRNIAQNESARSFGIRNDATKRSCGANNIKHLWWIELRAWLLTLLSFLILTVSCSCVCDRLGELSGAAPSAAGYRSLSIQLLFPLLHIN